MKFKRSVRAYVNKERNLRVEFKHTEVVKIKRRGRGRGRPFSLCMLKPWLAGNRNNFGEVMTYTKTIKNKFWIEVVGFILLNLNFSLRLSRYLSAFSCLSHLQFYAIFLNKTMGNPTLESEPITSMRISIRWRTGYERSRSSIWSLRQRLSISNVLL